MADRTPGDVAALITNPFYAINIDPMLAEPHEPLISEDEWIAANVKEIGSKGQRPTSVTCCRC